MRCDTYYAPHILRARYPLRDAYMLDISSTFHRKQNVYRLFAFGAITPVTDQTIRRTVEHTSAQRPF